MMRPDMHAFKPDLLKHLRHLRDVDRILLRIKTVRASLRDWTALHETCVHAKHIHGT